MSNARTHIDRLFESGFEDTEFRRVTLAALEAEGYEGSDANLSECLFEYGFAWKEEGNDIKIIYRDRYDSGKHFNTAFVRKDVDPRHEWNWIKNWSGVAETYGVTAEEFLAEPLPQLIEDLLRYYGSLEILGDSYGCGMFDVVEADNPEQTP